MVLLAQSAEAAGLEVKNSLRAYEIGVRGMEYTNVQPRTVFMSIKEQLKEFRKEINWLYKNPDALGRLIMRAGKIFDSKAFQSLWNQGQPGGSAGPLGEALTGNFIGFIASNLGTAGGGSTPFYGQGKRTEFERLGAMIGKQMGPKAGNAVMLAIKTAVEQGESPFVGFRGTVVVEKWMDAQGRTIPTGNLGMGAFTPTFVTGSGTGMSPDVEAALNDDGKNGPGRARGGPVRPYGTYVVGEKGPETLVMGSRAGYVIPNTGSQPIVVNVDGQKLFEIMNKRMGRAMAMGV
jgi:hypothetical protein